MKVTVRDVLDGGGEIKHFDPVMSEDGSKYHIADTVVCDGQILILPEVAPVKAIWRYPEEMYFYPDGVNIITSDDRLYRVTGHAPQGVGTSNIMVANIKPLIPDKPAMTATEVLIREQHEKREKLLGELVDLRRKMANMRKHSLAITENAQALNSLAKKE